MTTRLNYDLDSLKYCDDIKPSSDELAKWQQLLGGIPSWTFPYGKCPL